MYNSFLVNYYRNMELFYRIYYRIFPAKWRTIFFFYLKDGIVNVKHLMIEKETAKTYTFRPTDRMLFHHYLTAHCNEIK